MNLSNCHMSSDYIIPHSVDYWIVRRGNIHMPSVFIGDKASVYWYWRGINLRAYGAWVIGVALVVHGVAGALNPGSVNVASTRIYNMGFILSTLAGGVSYYGICKFWPVKIYPEAHAYEPTTWEHMAPTEGYFEDDNLIPDYLLDRGLFPGMGDQLQSESDEKDLERGLEKGGSSTRSRVIAV
jgi:nucleobase:cation symporter-1, NCS1 family